MFGTSLESAIKTQNISNKNCRLEQKFIFFKSHNKNQYCSVSTFIVNVPKRYCSRKNSCDFSTENILVNSFVCSSSSCQVDKLNMLL